MWALTILLLALQGLCSPTAAQTPYRLTRIEDIDPSLRVDEPSYLNPTFDEPTLLVTSSHERQSQPNYRLPNNTVPHSYDIHLWTRVDLGQFNFNGIVRIGLRAVTASNSITIHYRQLNISSVTLVSDAQPTTALLLGEREYDTVTEHFTIPTTLPLVANQNYTLTIGYEGELRLDGAGFYLSYYDVGNERRYLGTTQFESTDARHGFPCYDEPALKATYKIWITHGAAYTAVSNMPEVVRTPDPDDPAVVTTEFKEVPLMSTYLVAFIVSDFEMLLNNSSTIPHRVIARPSELENSRLTLEDGVRILDALGAYLGYAYDFEKMDQAALPHFNAGAMENWGLVTYRESNFFYNVNVQTYTQMRSIVTVIAHEFAHQWFGNLISPLWWQYIWLNEGFANLYQHRGTDLVYPEWKIMDLYVLNTLHGSLNTDANPNIRPMSHYVENTLEVGRLFDNIAYAKSGCVLRMFLNAFSEPTFQKGLLYYLQNMEYQAAEEEDLFLALERAVTEDSNALTTVNVPEAFRSWSNQPGVPVLQVTRNYENSEIALRQQRYFTDPLTPLSQNIYHIPYNYFTPTTANAQLMDTRATAWLTQRDQTLTDIDVESGDWIIFNKQQSGYYRIQYDEQNYRLIVAALNGNGRSQIHILNRAQLIDDAYSFAATGRTNYITFLDLINYLEHETEYVPWGAALTGITFLNRMLAGNEHYPRFRQFIRSRIAPLYNSVAATDDAAELFQRKYTRTLSLAWACDMGVESCRTHARAELDSIMESDGEFHQNVRGVLYCAAMRDANAAQYEFVGERLAATTDASLRSVLISALACSQNEGRLNAYLRSSLIENYSQADANSIFRAVVQNGQLGVRLGITFLTANIDEAFEKYGSLDSAITAIAPYAVSTELQTSFAQLLEVVEVKGYTENLNTIVNAIGNMAFNVLWSETHASSIVDWFDEHYPVPDGAAQIGVSLSVLLLAAVVALFRR